MSHANLLILGFIAGATILIGLPVGRIRGFGATPRTALSMLAAGIIMFLLVEILGQACGQAAVAVREALSGGSLARAEELSFLLVSGFALGLIGLVFLEQKTIRSQADPDPMRLSYMIAVGIGLHNLSEGLAIGQAFVQGLGGLTVSLITGFALHNATEGFGIMGPLVRHSRRPSWKTIFLLAAIGGGPTFLGTLLGSLWTSAALSVFVLAMAGGSLLYVLKELFAGARREPAQVAIMSSLVLGFALGWGTEIAANAGQSGTAQSSGAAASSPAADAAVDADGDVLLSPAAVAGHALSPRAVQAQDEAANGLLRERAMAPKILPDGTKEYDLTASVFTWELYPGVNVEAWGYNHQVPGPLIRLRVGDKAEFVVKNELPQATTVHWHGLAVPIAQDGVPGTTQNPIAPGGTFVYRFRVTAQMIGTHLYHTHVNDDFQTDQGLHGVLIIDPAKPSGPRYDVDALYELSSFKIGGSENENVFMMDGKAYPEAPTLQVPLGSRVLIRLANSSAEENHVMHLHGYTFHIVALDGNPLANPIAANTVLLGPFQTADIAFVASNPGAWMFHCHILDHLINPSPAGDGSATKIAAMGGLMTFVDVVPRNQMTSRYLPAETLMTRLNGSSDMGGSMGAMPPDSSR